MKKIVYFWIILLFSFSLTIGQTKGKATVRKPIVVSQSTEAEKAWIPFWLDFRKAIKSRDKDSFSRMMSNEYDLSGMYDNSGCKNLTDKKEALFCILTKRETDWWKYFNFVVDKPTKNEKSTLGKIEEFEAKITRSFEFYDSAGNASFAFFQYETNGKWHLIGRGQRSE